MLCNMLHNTRMPISEFRRHVAAARLSRLVHEHSVVEVGRYVSEVNAVVVDPDVFMELSSRAERLDELEASLPLLLAAVRSGVAVPSDTLTRLGFTPSDETWQAINAFQAIAPVHLTRGEDGEEIARGPLTGVFVPEADLELEPID
jgi:hypothetical protein